MANWLCSIIVTLVLLRASEFSQAAPTVEMPAKPAVADVFAPAPPESVVLTGRLGKKIDLCITARLLQQDVQAIVAPYRAKRETGNVDWRCEYWGKWYTSLALADAYRSTPASAQMCQYAGQELLATSAPDGYLGTRQPEHRLEGWDVWGCKYAMLGVLAYYDRTHDPAALHAARRQADVLITQLGPGATNIEDVGEWNGLPASSVLEPIVQLYERTGDAKYLQFAQYIVSCWSTPSRRLPRGMRLVEDALANQPPAKMCAPKSYEMMSCFEGLCELYRAAGDRRYLDASVNLANGVWQNEATLIGCGTSNEVWSNGRTKQTRVTPKPMETCVTATWMKFQYQLLRLTGDERYAEELEKNLYNGLLGAMMQNGEWWAYFSGLMGVRVPSYIQHADVGLSCCVVNGPRGLLTTPSWAFMTSELGPVINLYAPATAHLTTPGKHVVSVEISGDFPVEDRVVITVSPEIPESFSLQLRIPAWSVKTELTVNGESIPATPGSYAVIHRVWKTGDQVSLTFDMRGRAVPAPDANGQLAIVRGPIVLSLDNRLAQNQQGSVLLKVSAHTPIDLKPNHALAQSIGAWMAFDVPCMIDGKPGTVPLCEYAAAGNAFTDQNIFRTWLPQPFDLATVFKTRQTWQTLSHSGVWTDPPPLPQRVKDPALDLALAIHGSTATADSVYASVDSDPAKAIDGITGGSNGFENQRWHSSVESAHPHWIQVTLAHSSVIAQAVISPADPAGAPVRFEGQIQTRAGDAWKCVFRCERNTAAGAYTADFAPVEAAAFRLVIEASANPEYPNAAQVSEIELYPPQKSR